MQVNNNVQSPDFGMALKIKPTAKNFLKKQSLVTLESLQKLGEEFKDYKHWDLEIDDKGYRVAGKGALDGAYRNIRKPEVHTSRFDSFRVPVTADRFADKGKNINRYLCYTNPEDARVGFEKMNVSSNQLERTANFTRELEKLSAKEAYAESIKAQIKEAQANKISDLFGHFGVEV